MTSRFKIIGTTGRAAHAGSAACLVALVAAIAGCSPERDTQTARSQPALKSVQQSQNSEITPDKIATDIVGRKIRISDTGGANQNEWTFEASEFRRVAIIERKTTGKGETLVVFVTTQNNPESNEEQVRVAGKLQLTYVRKGGQWVLSEIENLNFQYSIGVAT